MPTPDPASVAAPARGAFAAVLEEGASWTSVAIPIAVALLVAFVLDRALSRRGRDVAKTVMGGELSP